MDMIHNESYTELSKNQIKGNDVTGFQSVSVSMCRHPFGMAKDSRLEIQGELVIRKGRF